ncbi:AfsR/SARP family transcriptional regulator [Actinoplanes sp. CA-054009]
MVEVRVLGPVEVVTGDTVVSGADRQLAVLAMLVAARGRTVTPDRLIDQLWDGEPPPSAMNSLQVYVSRLRRLLEPARRPRTAATILVSEGAGYALRLTDDAVDAWALDRALARVSALPPSRALATVEERLIAWRGTPYAQFAGEPWARPETARLEELRWSAREKVVELLLKLGRVPEVVSRATALTAEQPLRGEGWRLLALGLWTAGRSEDALAALRRHGDYLAEELGLDPEPALAALKRAIRSGTLAPDAAARPEALAFDTADRPEALAFDTADRPEALASDAADRLEALAGAQAAPVPDVRPAQLPWTSASFEGRVAQLRELTAHADRGDGTVLAVITGAGGVGKTTLALRWAHDVADRYEDGQLYADLRGFGPEDSPTDPGEVLAGFLGALGVPDHRVPPGRTERVALYRSVLAGRRMLLVLDNARDADQVRPLLPGTPGCAVVVTGRARLTGLVMTEGAREVRLDAFTDDEARAYLRARLRPEVADADPTARDAVIARCGGLPLALAVVCARAAAFPLPLVAAELATEQGLDAFTWPGLEHDPRAVFSWSYRHLPPSAATAFRRLALNPGADLTLAAAVAAIAAATNAPETNVSGTGALTTDSSGAEAPTTVAAIGGHRAGTRRLLRSLCDAHLLIEHQPDRFAYHDLIREYATELAAHLDPAPERDAVLRRLADHHLYSAANAAKVFYPFRHRVLDDIPGDAMPVAFAEGDQTAALAWMESEYRNAMALADHHPGPFAWAFASFQQDVHFYVEDSIALAELGVARAERDGDLWWISYLNYMIGRGHLRMNRPDAARPALERSTEVARRLGDPLRLGHGLLSLAISITGVHRVPTPEQAAAAYPYALEARENYRKLSGRMQEIGESDILRTVGWHHYYEPDGRARARAVACFRSAIEINARHGNTADAAETWTELGVLLHHAGDLPAAVEAFDTALTVHGDETYLRMNALIGLHTCHRERGDSGAADRVRAEAVSLMRTARYPDVERLTAILATSAPPDVPARPADRRPPASSRRSG